MIERNEQELILMAVAGDTAAFGELVRRHQRAVRLWLGKVSGDFALADDMAQDTFLKAWDSLGTYQCRGEFRHWLLKIAWTTFLQAKRRHRRIDRLAERVRHHGQEDAVGEADQAQPELDRLLGVLAPVERACILLSYSYGYSHGEVSAMLSMPLGTVKSNIRRGLLTIREYFGIAV